MRHKPETIAFAQGWLGNQLELAAQAQQTEEAQVMGEQVLTQWKLVDEALDDLLKERQKYQQAIEAIRISLKNIHPDLGLNLNL